MVEEGPTLNHESYTPGSRCLMCGTSKKPTAGRCEECGYFWVRSIPDWVPGNWHQYNDLTYQLTKDVSMHPEDEVTCFADPCEFCGELTCDCIKF